MDKTELTAIFVAAFGSITNFILILLSWSNQNKRFDDLNKRMDDLRTDMNKRFDDMYRYLDVRFKNIEDKLKEERLIK